MQLKDKINLFDWDDLKESKYNPCKYLFINFAFYLFSNSF